MYALFFLPPPAIPTESKDYGSLNDYRWQGGDKQSLTADNTDMLCQFHFDEDQFSNMTVSAPVPVPEIACSSSELEDYSYHFFEDSDLSQMSEENNEPSNAAHFLFSRSTESASFSHCCLIDMFASNKFLALSAMLTGFATALSIYYRDDASIMTPAVGIAAGAASLLGFGLFLKKCCQKPVQNQASISGLSISG